MHGEYKPPPVKLSVVVEEQEIALAAKPIHITRGYLRDKRLDLKQLMLDLICSEDGDLPLYLALVKETINNQLGKATQYPTLRWVF